MVIRTISEWLFQILPGDCRVLILSTYFTLPLFSLVSGPGGEAARTATGETPEVAPRETGQPRKEGWLSPSQVLTTK